VVKTSSVGQVGHELLAPSRLGRARHPTRAGEQADVQIGAAGPTAKRGEPALVKLRRTNLQPRQMLAPCGVDVDCIEAEDRGHGRCRQAARAMLANT
jgi:hypothetical protein